MEARDEDFINKFFIASSHDHVLFFTDRGRVFLKKVYEMPEGSRTSQGQGHRELRGPRRQTERRAREDRRDACP
jgi:DNA gyrase/topoisomerase IV subunit A